MGVIHFSIDTNMVTFLSRQLPFEIFFESGTFKGDSIERVKKQFNRLYSVELSEHYFELSKLRFKNDPQVKIIHGDASVVLKNLNNQFSGKSILYWLDSHWCDAEATEGATCQCSLLKELEAIELVNDNSVVLIDDARLFLSPPGIPHDYTQWPDIDELFRNLKEKSASHNLMVLNDVIIFFPEKIKAELKFFSHQNGADWLTIMDMYRQTKDVIMDLDAKEKEIKSLADENKVLVKEIQAKENEILLKHQEINNISLVAEQRLNIINQFGAAKEDIRTGFKNEINALKKVLEQKKRHINTLNEMVAEKDKLYSITEEVVEARLRVIREQENVIRSMRRRRPVELIRLWLQPRLGALYHYHPRPIKIPEKYYKDQKKATPSDGWPLISIVTPSFNQVAFIERTMQSVFQQQFPKLEYLIQDGGSDDGTVDILKKYEDRLGHWESVKDEGQSDALHKCF